MREPRASSTALEDGPAPASSLRLSKLGHRPKILTFTTLYPNAVSPHYGVFVENRLRKLLDIDRVSASVVAPVPWFPSPSSLFGRYAELAAIPAREERFGISVEYPRYPVIPKVGMSLAPFLLYASARRHIQRMIDDGLKFDLIDAHYFYPDGVAAVMLGRHFGRPITITACGTDINLIPEYAIPRRLILWAAERADGLITVSRALKVRLSGLGVPDDRIVVLCNGVDPEMFSPSNRVEARARLGLTGTTLLSVGNLVANKGHDISLKALSAIPDASLVIIGNGIKKNALIKLAENLDLMDRVRFVPAMPQAELAVWYAAADVLILATEREGIPNVILEAMACGTPVVATDVGGIGEVISSPEAGILLPERSPEAVASAVRGLIAHPPPRGATTAYAKQFDWKNTAMGQQQIFDRILGSRHV